MEPIHQESEHRFSLALPEGEAVLKYEREGEVVTFTHTFVPTSLRGRGLADILVKSGLTWARQNAMQIRATCTYVERFLQRHPEFLAAPPSR